MKLPNSPLPLGHSQTKPLHRRLLTASPGLVGVVKNYIDQQSVIAFAKRHGIKVVTRKLNGTGVAVWRIEP